MNSFLICSSIVVFLLVVVVVVVMVVVVVVILVVVLAAAYPSRFQEAVALSKRKSRSSLVCHLYF